MSKSQRKSCTQFNTLKQTIEYKQSPQKHNRHSHKEINNNPEKVNNARSSKVNMELVFQANQDYLMEKISISQIPRPSKYYHKIPFKTPNTTYNNQFHKTNTNNHMNQLKLERKDNLFNQKYNVTNYESLYGQNFGHLDQRTKSLASSSTKDNNSALKKKEKAIYQPLEGPTFLDTSYSVNFIKHNNPIPTQSAKMKEINLMGGGKFKGQSHYNGAFKGLQQKRQKPVHHQNHKIFMTIIAPKQTTYGKQFSSIKNSTTLKPKSVSKALKTVEEPKSSRKRVTSQMMETSKEMEKKKFTSEYERSFQTLQAPNSSRSKKVSLMSMQEMKNLILNIL